MVAAASASSRDRPMREAGRRPSRRASTATGRRRGCRRWRGPRARPASIRARAGREPAEAQVEGGRRAAAWPRTDARPAPPCPPRRRTAGGRRSAPRARAASSAPPVQPSSSACTRRPRPCSRAAAQDARGSPRRVKTPSSQKTSQKRARPRRATSGIISPDQRGRRSAPRSPRCSTGTSWAPRKVGTTVTGWRRAGVADGLQRAELGRGLEAVAALDLGGGGAAASISSRRRHERLGQLVHARPPAWRATVRTMPPPAAAISW